MTAPVANHLRKRGEALFASRGESLPFCENPDADALLRDLKGHPHALVVGCLMDRQIRAELAWAIPYEIQQRLGTFSFGRLRRLTLPQVQKLLTKPRPLHRYPSQMSRILHLGIQRIAEEYDGDASKIWSGSPSSAAVVLRFLQFWGVGPKIATMATNILAREMKVPFSDYYSIDISVDVHVRRVFERLGLIRSGASVEEIVYTARALHPEFPGLVDLPAWEIGRSWCRPRRMECGACYMGAVCPSAT